MRAVVYLAILVVMAGCNIDKLFGPPDIQVTYQFNNQSSDAVRAQVIGLGVEKRLGDFPPNTSQVFTDEFEVRDPNVDRVTVNFNILNLRSGQLISKRVNLARWEVSIITITDQDF